MYNFYINFVKKFIDHDSSKFTDGLDKGGMETIEYSTHVY